MKTPNPAPGPKKIAPPIDPQTLGATIISISQSMQKLLRLGLNRRAIVVLIKDQSGDNLSKKAIVEVLDNLEKLAETYCK